MNRPLSVYLASLTGAFAGLVGVLVTRGDTDALTDWRTWLPLLAVAMLVEAFEVSVGDHEGGAALSFSGAAHVAGVILFGPLVAALIAAGAVVLVDGVRSWSPRVVLANAALFGWASLAAGGAYELAGGTVGRLTASSAVAVVVLVVTRGLVNVTLFSIGDALASGLPVRAAIRATMTEGAMTYLGEGSMGVLIAAGWNSQDWLILPFLLPLFAALYGARANLERLRRETASALNAFAHVIDERDPHTARHTERVAGYVESFAQTIRLPEREAQRLAAAARYHDLGKIAVDEATLSKAARLSDDEVRAIRRHPRLSATLLSPFGFARDIARIVELHHERYDGRGYYEVAGSDVPLEAHVLIVADSFDAMTSKRAYRPALSFDEAAHELRDKAGTQFHPGIARAFAAMVDNTGGPPNPEELADLRAGFDRVSTAPSIPWRLWSDLPTATIGALAAVMLAISLTPSTAARGIAIVTLLVICVPALVASSIRRRRTARALALAREGAPTIDALRAANIQGQPTWLRWDAQTDRYLTTGEDRDADEACRRARLSTAGSLLNLHSGAFAVLTAPTADRSRLAVVFGNRPSHRDARLVEQIAEATPCRQAEEARLGSSDAPPRPSTALVISLDVFERVRLGAGQLAAAHSVGAAVDAVRAVLRDGDTVEPLGEDELVAWVSATGADEVAALRDRLAQALAAVPLPARLKPIAPRFALASSPTLPVDLAARARLTHRSPANTEERAAR
jgi:hypothetical protein